MSKTLVFIAHSVGELAREVSNWKPTERERVTGIALTEEQQEAPAPTIYRFFIDLDILPEGEQPVKAKSEGKRPKPALAGAKEEGEQLKEAIREEAKGEGHNTPSQSSDEGLHKTFVQLPKTPGGMASAGQVPTAMPWDE